jgi:hypothetical protein
MTAMRILLALLLVAAAPVHADPPAKAIEQLVTTHLTKVGNREAVDKLGFAKDPTAVVAMVPWSPGDPALGTLFNPAGGKASVKLGAPAIAIGDGFAWFQSPYDLHVVPEDIAASGDIRPIDVKQRVGGLAIQTPAGWALAAIHYATLISDKDLFDVNNERNNGGNIPMQPITQGDAPVAKEIAGWFPSGLAGHAATRGTLIASGTSPTEFATGAATAALAKTWDKIGLVAGVVAARIVVPGKVGFAHVSVFVPRKGGGKPTEMMLTIVLVREGASWRWVSLEFSA